MEPLISIQSPERESQQASDSSQSNQEAINFHRDIGKKKGRKEKAGQIRIVKSRNQLIEEEKQYYENLQKKVLTTRRTKIIATISQKHSSQEVLKQMYQAGVSAFMLNLAYASKDLIKQLNTCRQEIEKEFSNHIPLICILKGKLIRIGQLEQATVYLQKGQEYRLILNDKILGDQFICGVDDNQFADKLQVGDKLLIDYGNVTLNIKSFEKSDQSLQYLQSQCNYGKSFKKIPHYKNSFQRFKESTSASEDADENGHKADTSQCNSQLELDSPNIDHFNKDPEYKPLNNRLQKQLEEIIVKKNKTYKVIVCNVDSACFLKSFKPIFVYSSKEQQNLTMKSSQSFQMSDKKSKLRSSSQRLSHSFINILEECNENADDEEDSEEDDFGSEVLTAKDIADIDFCMNNHVDSICICNARKSDDIKAVRNLIGERAKEIKIICRIQTREAVKNFDDIVKCSDGIILSRGYLTLFMPVERLPYEQEEMIKKCHQYLKPVFISANILDSMVTSLLPTSCEVGEIDSIVQNSVDSIILSNETSMGNNPIDAIETLSRICLETESRQIQKCLNEPNQRGQISIKSSQPKNTILNVVVSNAMSAAYQTQASLIICFSSSGATAIKLSKLKPPCPIIMFSGSLIVARNVNLLASISSIFIDTEQINAQQLVLDVINKFKKQDLVKSGDIIIVTSCDNCNSVNFNCSTNTMTMIIVQ